MGNIFIEPTTMKESSLVESEKFICGSSSMQGWRPTMEDAHIHILSHKSNPDYAIFAIFDGHGGFEVANYVSENIVDIFFSQTSLGDIPKALNETFLKMDALCREAITSNTVGSTGNVVVVKENQIFCANIGDTRTVVSIGGIAHEISEDHKPHGSKELERIVNAGGFVTNYRVNGSLALSRAFGDFQYKLNTQLPPEKQLVIAVPDITMMKMNPAFEFFVMGCDGIWDVMTNQEVVNFVRLRIAASMPPDMICEELMTNCLAPDARMGGLGCDNMTVVISCFLQDRTTKLLRHACAMPVMYNMTTNIIKPEKVTP